MHTFCQFCVTQWKKFEKNRAPVVGCPVCRESITSEKRNFSIDNIIGIIVDCYSEEEMSNRKELVNQHQELNRNLLSGNRQPDTPNPFYQITNRNVFMGEMRVEDIPQLPRINNLRNGQFSLFCKYLYNSNKISKLFLVIMQLLNVAVRLCQ
jgi:hypothetical protein